MMNQARDLEDLSLRKERKYERLPSLVSEWLVKCKGIRVDLKLLRQVTHSLENVLNLSKFTKTP